MVTRTDLEALARDLRRLAGLRDDALPFAVDIATAVLGRDRVVFGVADMPARVAVDGTIVVPRGHPDLNFAVAHELAEITLARVGFSGSHVDRERAANYLAAAILAPPSTVRRAYSHWGERRLDTMSRAFALSQTSMVLRLAEVREDERAVVTRTGRVLLRARHLQAEDVLAVAHAGRRMPGVTKALLRGGIDDGRVAVVAVRRSH